MKILLGSKVKDKISGYSGVAVGRTEFLYGCIRIEVDSSSLDKEGNVREPTVFDEAQLEVLEGPSSELLQPATKVVRAKSPSGPRDSVGRRPDFVRRVR